MIDANDKGSDMPPPSEMFIAWLASDAGSFHRKAIASSCNSNRMRLLFELAFCAGAYALAMEDANDSANEVLLRLANERQKFDDRIG